MELSLQEFFSRAFVLTTDKSKLVEDFYLDFARKFNDVPAPRRLDGVRLKILPNGCPPYGIYKSDGKNHYLTASSSHYYAVALASALDWPLVVMMEDDLCFRDDSRTLLEQTLEAVPEDAALVKLCCQRVGKGFYKKPFDNSGISKLLLPGESTWGAQMYVVFRRYYAKMLETMNAVDYLIDGAVLSPANLAAERYDDMRYDVYRSSVNIAENGNNIRRTSKFEIPLCEPVESDLEFVLTTGRTTPGDGKIRLFCPMKQKVPRFVHVSSPKSGFLLGVMNMMSLAKSCGWDRVKLLSEEFAASGRSFPGFGTDKSSVIYDSFGLPIALDIVKKDFNVLQKDYDTYGDGCDPFGALDYACGNPLA